MDVQTPTDIKQRVEIIRRRDQFELDPVSFVKKWKRETNKLSRRLANARGLIASLEMDDQTLGLIAEICIELGTDGLRGELTLIKAARAFAAWKGDALVDASHVQSMAPLALSHRLRRDPLDDARSSIRVERVLEDVIRERSAA